MAGNSDDSDKREVNLISEGNLKLEYIAPRKYRVPAGTEFRFNTKGMYFKCVLLH